MATTTDIEAFVQKLREETLIAASGATGRDVLEVLFKLTDDMNSAGVDRAWTNAPLVHREACDSVFCITWMTMLLTGLYRLTSSRQQISSGVLPPSAAVDDERSPQ
jgi:hypothetical protein